MDESTLNGLAPTTATLLNKYGCGKSEPKNSDFGKNMLPLSFLSVF
jgi:hypothetical protein